MKNTLGKELEELKALIEIQDQQCKDVSIVSIGWHIDHSLRVMTAVCKSILKSDPKEYRYKRNKNRSKIKLIGYIPRGLGKAPEAVMPDAVIETEHLLLRLDQNKLLLEKFDSLEPNAFFKHPVFGGLNKKNAEWFLKLHTRHHLKIIREIANKR